MLGSLAMAVLLGSAGPQASPPLRSVSERLLHELDDARAEPALKPGVAWRCPRGKLSFSKANPYSRLTGERRRQHVRIETQLAHPQQTELYDAISFRLPRRLGWTIELPPEPRLEFAYKLYPCGAGEVDATATIRVSGPGFSPFETTVPLTFDRRARRLDPWRPVAVELPSGASGPVSLEVSFANRTVGRRAPVLLWGQPLVTGRSAPKRPARDRNLLFILVDAVRGDVVGPGRKLPRPVAPAMEAAMARGAAFTRAYSNANRTRTSVLGLMLSQPGLLAGFHVPTWYMPHAKRRAFYRTRPVTLPSILAARGWRTAAVEHNKYMHPMHERGLDHGFDQLWSTRQEVKDTAAIAARASQFLREHRESRWFLYVDIVAPHRKYRPPKRFRQLVQELYPKPRPRGIDRRYLAEIAYADEAVDTILKTLDELGLAERTLVVLTSDHGELFEPPHHCISKSYGQQCHDAHGLTLYDEELHVPLAFVLPDVVKAGHVVRSINTHLDVAPTLLEVLGLPPAPSYTGKSFSAALFGGAGGDSAVFAEGRRSYSFRHGALKLHVHFRFHPAYPVARVGESTRGHRLDWRDKLADAELDYEALRPLRAKDLWIAARRGQPPLELFDLEADPGETRNLALEGDPRVAEMLRRLARYRRELRARRRLKHAEAQ